MAELRGGRRKGRDNLSRSSTVLRSEGSYLGRTPPKVAVLLSLISWPEPECPASLKPLMVLAAILIWLGLAVLATYFGPSAGFWPILPIAAVFLLASFVGGSVISMFAATLFSIGLHFGLWSVYLPDLTREMVVTGYRHKDFLMFLIFTWICGVPHWRRRFSGLFTLLWGLGVVFTPVLYILINVYGFYGHLPQSIILRFMNREFLIAWGVTVIVAAVAAKILYLIKDFLRRILS